MSLRPQEKKKNNPVSLFSFIGQGLYFEKGAGYTGEVWIGAGAARYVSKYDT